jgi:hypothetical protein
MDFCRDFLSCKETKCPAAAVVSPDQLQGTVKSRFSSKKFGAGNFFACHGATPQSNFAFINNALREINMIQIHTTLNERYSHF